MAQTIGLNELIETLNKELLLPRKAEHREEMFPFLFVEEIELDVSVVITHSGSGSGKVSIQVVELNAEGKLDHEKTNSIKIKLSPLLTKEEIRASLKKDTRLWERIESKHLHALVKDVFELAGEEE